MVSHCGLNCIFLITGEVEYLFMLLDSYISVVLLLFYNQIFFFAVVGGWRARSSDGER